MRKITFTFLLTWIFLFSGVNAQAPQGINYQAAVRDASGMMVTNQQVGLRFDIQQGSIGGTSVYMETFSVTTSDLGMVDVIIGTGATTDSFPSIDWSNGPYFLETAIDVNGGTSYTVMGTTQLLSVPYALFSGSADSLADPIWKKNGTEAYYDQGNVGIGTDNPADFVEVISSNAGGVLVSMEKSNAAAGNDVLELRTQTGGPDDAAFIEMQRGSTVEARVNTDGSAEFLSVTVEENLNSTTTPTTGRVYANGLPIAYGYVSSGTTSATLITDYGVASITKPTSTTGVYQITLNKAISGSPVIIATCFNSSPNDEIATTNSMSSTQIEVNTSDGSGTAINTNFYFVVFGTVQ